MSSGIPVIWMRGGTSKGGYFLASDLPSDSCQRDRVLLGVMGSPDPRQIDGMGGADPLTSKVAVVSRSERAGVDVDFLFLQVFVDRALVSDEQNCGNILAAVGQFAIERDLVRARSDMTPVTVYMENSGQTAVATIKTPGGRVTYEGTARIDGVPGYAAPVAIEFRDTAGSSCGALFPTGNVVDEVEGVPVTLVDNGMPVVVMTANSMGIAGNESPEELEANRDLRGRLENVRVAAGHAMNLGDVGDKSVPKLTMLGFPGNGGAIASRTFIPHRCHKAIGVFGAVSVATSCLTAGAIGNDMIESSVGSRKVVSIEHPTGEMTVVGEVKDGLLVRAEVLRTARKLMEGIVYPSEHI